MNTERLSRDFSLEPLIPAERPSKEDLLYLLIELNWTRLQIANYFSRSESQVKRWLHDYQIKKPKSLKGESIRRGVMQKYGVENISQLQEIKDKKEQKSLDKYGVKNVFSSEEIKEKIKETNMKKYGCENIAQNKDIQAKIRATNLEKYGTESPLQNEEIKQLIKELNIEKYGVPNPCLNPEVVERIKETNMKKYGHNSYTQSEQGKKTLRESYLKHYGVPNPMFVQECKDNLERTNIKRYGCWSSQRHISKDSLKIMSSQEDFEKFLKTRKTWTTRTLADALGVSIGTIWNKLKAYDLVRYISIYTSSYELELQSLFPHMHKTKSAIHPYEIDLYDEERKFGIEFNGNYWHSELKLPNDYHQKKSLVAEEHGIFLYHIFEYEWQDPILREKILSQIKNIMGNNSRKVYARKCELRHLNSSEARRFLDENHIQGYAISSVNLGLYYEYELVAVMTFGKPRFDKKCEWELVRYCSLKDTSVVGGSSKLFKAFLKLHNPKSILSYSHISKTRGGMYKELGFNLEKISSPDYVWNNTEDTFTRYQCQKHKLNALGYEGSEREIMDELGFFRIFGCGNKVWIWNN